MQRRRVPTEVTTLERLTDDDYRDSLKKVVRPGDDFRTFLNDFVLSLPQNEPLCRVLAEARMPHVR
jgi:hypothetical protein